MFFVLKKSMYFEVVICPSNELLLQEQHFQERHRADLVLVHGLKARK